MYSAAYWPDALEEAVKFLPARLSCRHCSGGTQTKFRPFIEGRVPEYIKPTDWVRYRSIEFSNRIIQCTNEYFLSTYIVIFFIKLVIF